MISISLCLIVKNEEDVIKRVLESAQDIADEIIIVDTGSQDQTKEIALEFTDHVYDFQWIDDFSAARNFSFSKATMDYILWLDADDVILEQDKGKFLQLKQRLSPSVDMVMMKYNIAFDEHGNPTFSYFRERLMSRKKHYRWVEPVHEVIVPMGNVIYEDIAITHRKIKASDPSRNIQIIEHNLAQGMEISPRLKFYYARELRDLGRYEDAIRMFHDFLESPGAWVPNCIEACQNLADTYRTLGKAEEGLNALLQSLRYGLPCAEVCCSLGQHFMDRHDFQTAIFWYTLASNQEVPKQDGGFHSVDCYGYIPFIQLCVCYDKLGDHDKAAKCNEQAAQFKPEDASIAHNRKYFSKLL